MNVFKTHPELLHYTNWAGLRGILNSNSLWATHYRHLNDASETLHTREILKELIKDDVIKCIEEFLRKNPQIRAQQERLIDQKGGMEKFRQEQTNHSVESFYKACDVISSGFYFFSFCGTSKSKKINENGLLSQWRGYGNDGGFAIVFNTEKLEKRLALHMDERDYITLDILEVIYDPEKAKNKIIATMPQMKPYLIKMIRSGLNLASLQNDDNDVIAYNSLIECTACYKHPGFAEENEVRIVAQPIIHYPEYLAQAKSMGKIPNPEVVRGLRWKENESVPYIDILSPSNQPLPIERIIVGPHKNQSLRAEALETFLQGQKIEIIKSDIPYVG